MAPTHEGLRSNQWPLGCGTVPHDRRFRFALSCSGTGIENGEQFTELARKAEALGYSTLFVPDHFVDHPLAPTVALTHAAAVTTTLRVGSFEASVDYEPGESTSDLFGGNSNWRGPVWMPVNYLLVEALRRFASFYGDDFTVDFPTGSGVQLTLAAVADKVTDRLCGIFLRGADGRRPVLGEHELLVGSAAWRDLVPFHEYFHGESGRGLGASHQTGWTGLIADLIITRRRSG